MNQKLRCDETAIFLLRVDYIGIRYLPRYRAYSCTLELAVFSVQSACQFVNPFQAIPEIFVHYLLFSTINSNFKVNVQLTYLFGNKLQVHMGRVTE